MLLFFEAVVILRTKRLFCWHTVIRMSCSFSWINGNFQGRGRYLVREGGDVAWDYRQARREVAPRVLRQAAAAAAAQEEQGLRRQLQDNHARLDAIVADYRAMQDQARWDWKKKKKIFCLAPPKDPKIQLVFHCAGFLVASFALCAGPTLEEGRARRTSRMTEEQVTRIEGTGVWEGMCTV